MTPEEIVKGMFDNDAFSQWLGIDVLDVGKGYSKLRMIVRNEMTNGFGIGHGGITFSLADSTLAFACNSVGRHAVSIHCDISHINPVQVGDELTAVAEQVSVSNRIGVYDIKVRNQNDVIVAVFKGTVYRKSSEWNHETGNG